MASTIAATAASRSDHAEHRHPRHHPEARVERVGDGLRRVGRGRQDGAIGRQDAGQQRATQTRALLVGPDEEHRQEPQVVAPHGGREADDPLAAFAPIDGWPGRDDEAVRVS